MLIVKPFVPINFHLFLRTADGACTFAREHCLGCLCVWCVCASGVCVCLVSVSGGCVCVCVCVCVSFMGNN